MPVGSKVADCMLLQRQFQKAIFYKPIARLFSHPYADSGLAKILKGREYNIIK